MATKEKGLRTPEENLSKKISKPIITLFGSNPQVKKILNAVFIQVVVANLENESIKYKVISKEAINNMINRHDILTENFKLQSSYICAALLDFITKKYPESSFKVLTTSWLPDFYNTIIDILTVCYRKCRDEIKPGEIFFILECILCGENMDELRVIIGDILDNK